MSKFSLAPHLPPNARAVVRSLLDEGFWYIGESAPGENSETYQGFEITFYDAFVDAIWPETGDCWTRDFPAIWRHTKKELPAAVQMLWGRSRSNP